MEFYPGIVNTCFSCGQPCQGVYAPNLDVAIAGGGKCAGCAPEALPEVTVTVDGVPVEGKVETITITTDDGINDQEASAAGQVLAAKRKQGKKAKQ